MKDKMLLQAKEKADLNYLNFSQVHRQKRNGKNNSAPMVQYGINIKGGRRGGKAKRKKSAAAILFKYSDIQDLMTVPDLKIINEDVVDENLASSNSASDFSNDNDEFQLL